jgi:valyl-tRNA synthetase
MESINKRINKIAIEFFDGNNSKFADTIGTSEANIRNYRTKTEPKIAVLNQIAKNLEICYEWLLNGTGEMRRKPNEKEVTVVSEVIAQVPLSDFVAVVRENERHKITIEENKKKVEELEKKLAGLAIHTNAPEPAMQEKRLPPQPYPALLAAEQGLDYRRRQPVQ